MENKPQVDTQDVPFSNKGYLYDMNTFYGRYQHYSRANSSLNVFYTNDTLKEYNESIKDFLATGETKLSNKELWNRNYIVGANLHPESGEPISFPFRFAALPILNMPVIAGIALLPPTPINQAISQTVNQCYNFGVNVANASLANPMTRTEMIVSTIATCGTAIGISVGFRKLLLKIKSQNPVVRGITFLCPWLAVAMASTANQFCARYKDLETGFEVIDPRTGQLVPEVKSLAAGRQGFFECLSKWWLLGAFAILGPQFSDMAMKKTIPIYKKNKKVQFLGGLVSIWVSQSYGSTFGLSQFAPLGSIKLKYLEPNVKAKLEGLDDETVINFYKGL